MNLAQFFNKDQIIKLDSSEKQLVIKELVEKLNEQGIIENKDRYYAQIIHRESLENTGIGNGFAIPHARTESISNFNSIMGISKKGVDYQAYDDKPVHFILLSIFPSEMSTKYLYLIGMIARIFSSSEKEIFNTEFSPHKIYSLLQKESDLYFDAISEKDNDDIDTYENLSGVPSSNLDLLIRLDRLYKLYDEEDKSELILNKIEGLKKLIDNRSLTYYERMRKKRDNPFSIVERNNCSGCHMGIPPININMIQKGKEISICPHCGRFLILV